MGRIWRWLKTKWLEFKYRDYDEDVCCCGGNISRQDGVCYHGGCRSLKEYVISKHFKDTKYFKDAEL